MTILATETVGQLATEYPLATRVFARYNIDFCCGGGRPLADVCAERELDIQTVLGEIEAALETPSTDTTRWDAAPLGDLIDHILAVHHEPLYEELERLQAMADRVLTVHGSKDPERLTSLADTVRAITADLIPHMAKEEQILFPMIRAGQGQMAQMPVRVMLMEHDTVGDLLRRLRTLTNDYTVPPEACNTWTALWHGLAALEADLHQHIHLENNILFPRALENR